MINLWLIIVRFFDTDNLSDVIIKFHGREVKCHKIILCAASDYFKMLCGAESKFKEASQKTIELKDDEDPDAVEAMLAYIYSFEYSERFKPKGSDPMFHFSVLVTADKYLIPRLFGKALAAFASTKSSLNENAEEAWKLIKLDAKYPDQHADIDKAVKELKKQHLHHLIMKPELHSTLPNDTDLHELIREKFDTKIPSTKFVRTPVVTCCGGLVYAVGWTTGLIQCRPCYKHLMSNGRLLQNVTSREWWAPKT